MNLLENRFGLTNPPAKVVIDTPGSLSWVVGDVVGYPGDDANTAIRRSIANGCQEIAPKLSGTDRSFVPIGVVSKVITLTKIEVVTYGLMPRPAAWPTYASPALRSLFLSASSLGAVQNTVETTWEIAREADLGMVFVSPRRSSPKGSVEDATAGSGTYSLVLPWGCVPRKFTVNLSINKKVASKSFCLGNVVITGSPAVSTSLNSPIFTLDWSGSFVSYADTGTVTIGLLSAGTSTPPADMQLTTTYQLGYPFNGVTTDLISIQLQTTGVTISGLPGEGATSGILTCE